MSYNGIGLQTPRGSGTNGYVMRNLSHVKRTNGAGNKKMQEYDEKSLMKRTINPEISKHERRRRIESKVLLFREELLAHTESQQTRYPDEGSEERETEKGEGEGEGDRNAMFDGAKQTEESGKYLSHDEAQKRDEEIELLVQEYREKLWKEAEEEDRYHRENNFESLLQNDQPSGARSRPYDRNMDRERNDSYRQERSGQKYEGRLETRRDVSPTSPPRRSHYRGHRDSYYRGRDRYPDDVEKESEPEGRFNRWERPRRKEYDSYSSYRPRNRRHGRSRSISRSPSPRNRSDTRFRTSEVREERNFRPTNQSINDRERSPPERGELVGSNSPVE
ncbi:complexed with Cdc5 protein Cwf21 [Schizosaccharomyces cryophilus OY26]|uniref:Complexed with Cdc5 protein Cwf21 n=1 Tax=Schizosaccharomyces cryophilus (strain OY26 / ATCC MYA-4695 / CBS 11777 / NBRC 106824 / NRRL Y48691) TaxID=653667 RepID=S9W224_SCHCR|nr:complexed with Cdc5 protein Cwf21 [Schizosaccharomyces cryophilus OY26]EPY52399.1 complexed with Cdc5 protein Cwf21 [Schizosaccharomyces cryophilus OY26]